MKVIAAYIPVLHKGHQEFFQKVRPDRLYVLGKSFLNEIAIVKRDIRALDPDEIVLACKAMGLARDIRVLEKEELPALREADTIVFPHDEVMHHIADTYLVGIPVLFENVFLRWDKMAAITVHPIGPDVIISKRDVDREYMRKARQHARKSSDWWRQVGALIVKDGKIILEGFNKHQPTENAPYINGDPRSNFNAGEHLDVCTALHGEAGLIAQAAHEGISLRDASLYVTTFPCPNCALLIIHAGIKTVYYADGYSKLNAQEHLKIAGVKLMRVTEA